MKPHYTIAQTRRLAHLRRLKAHPGHHHRIRFVNVTGEFKERLHAFCARTGVSLRMGATTLIALALDQAGAPRDPMG